MTNKLFKILDKLFFKGHNLNFYNPLNWILVLCIGAAFCIFITVDCILTGIDRRIG